MSFFPTQTATIPCASCGELFTPGSPQSLYCSYTCKQRAKRHRRRSTSFVPISSHPRHQRKVSPYYAILYSPTLHELQLVCEDFQRRAEHSQAIYVENKPNGFTLPPGLRDNEYENVYKIAFK